MNACDPRFVILASCLLLVMTSPASAQPATVPSPVAEAASAADGGADGVGNFGQLARPNVAASLALTTEQQATIQQLLAERDAAMAAAEPTARPAVTAASEEKLRAVLNAEQQRLFAALFTGKTLRFNFRNQKWADVLDWVSKEADLSLVMETPPPGTFHYADSKDYSTTEAIDLLNGWLLTKGFTLVRRERMLMCLDLKGGLPEGAVPRVTPAELATRGRFEFVSVLLPLEGRPAEAVLLEVKPLLGTYGKSEALAQTQQLLVSDTASNLRTIEQVLAKIPVPKKAETPKPPEPPKAILVVYPTQHVNPSQAGEVLRQIIVGNIVVDEKARQISINAIPAEQDKAKSMLAQLESNQGPDQQPKLQLYAVSVADSEQVLATLRLIAPAGQYRTDSLTGKLVAWAAPQDHVRIAESLSLLQSDATAAGGRQLQIHDAERVDTTSVSALLATLAPQATVTVDAVNRRLLVVATDEDQAIVRNVLEQVQTAEADALRVLKSYPLQPKVTTAAITALLASLIPQAAIVPDEANRRLLITATESDHRTAVEVIEQVQQHSGGVLPELKFYPVGSVSGTTALGVLQSIVPSARITFQSEAGRLSVIATGDDHTRIAETLAQLETSSGDVQRELKFYDVSQAGAADARTLLASTVSDVTFSTSADGSRLIAWVSPAQDQRIQGILETLRRERPFESGRTMELYSIRDLGPSATTVLGQAVPGARISAGARPDQLAIVATAADHEQLHKVIEQLQASKSVAVQKVLSVHPVSGVSPTAVLQVLQPLIDADVQVTVDNAGRQLFVRASPDKQEQITALVRQVTASLSEKGARTTKTYVVGAPNADEAQEVLLALFPDARIVTDADRSLIVATALAEQHVTIAEITSQMRGDGQSDRPAPAVYSLKNASAVEVQSLLQSMYSRFDNVRLSVNEKTGRLVVVARPNQQDAIRQLIEQLDATPRLDARQELAVFRLNQIDGLAIQQALRPLLPASAQVTADRIGRQLFVSALATDMPAIRELVQQMLSTPGTPAGVEVRSYRMRPYDADAAQEVLQRMFPDATLVTDSADEVLLATATPEQHLTIANVVQQMSSRQADTNGPQAKAYPLRTASAENAMEVLDELFGRFDNVRLSFDPGSNSLLAVARPEQHAVIRAMLDELEPRDVVAVPRTLEIYPLSGMYGTGAVEIAKSILQPVDPAATVSADRASRKLLVSTLPAGHERIREAMDRLQQSDPREMDVIQLRFLSASSAQNAIEGLYSDAGTPDDNYPVIQSDEDAQQLLVRGTPDQIRDIRTLLAKMGETGLADSGSSGAVANRHFRTIPITEDVETTVRRIQDLWPRVRRNPLRVLRPGTNLEPAVPGQPSPEARPPEEKLPGQYSVPAEALQDQADQAVSQEQVKDPAAGAPASDESAPVIIVAGDGRVTIASDDTEALDQLEALLRASASRPAPGRNRDFSVYQLRNAGAEDVAETLESVYESKAGLLAFGSVALVAEPRMNALIVYGNRSDRDRIEQLLEILDSEKLPDSGRIFRTQVIPVRFADAGRIEAVLRGVYRSEMAAGGSRRAIDIPTGVDSSVASVLRQINAAASAPLLSIEVQEETNSLVAKAPQNLIDEITELINQLDHTAETTRARGVTLIPLQKTNTRRVMRILDDVLQNR